MTSENFHGINGPPGTAAGPEVCARCHQPLTLRGGEGECLRCLVGFAMESGDEPHPPPLRYGHFEIDLEADGFPAELGAGAMAVTYRARDTVLHSWVALKVINKNVAEHPAARARFLREARAAAGLHHPNVAGVTHYGEQDGECFYVMELVEGETLEARVRREGPLPVALVLEIAVQVTRALAAAEACGVVHRDLKPSNIMLTERPGEGGGRDSLTVKVIDWGLAKAVGAAPVSDAARTRGGFVGTPAFASPEQFARVAEGRIDTRADFYSLGVTLWFLLCGRTPFTGDTLDEIHARQTQEPLPLGQLSAARVPAGVVALLRSLLAVDPAARPPSARGLLDTLRRCQEAFPAVAPPPPRGRRRRWAAVLGLAVLAGLGAVGWWWHSRPPPLSADRSIAVLPFENASPDQADAFFTVGVQDEITADLARVAALKVIGSDSTRSYAPGVRDLPRIARELGVRHLLEGSVRREGGQVHVGVRLADVRDPTHPWAEQYDRRLTDVFVVQGEVTRAVAARLDASLSPGEKAAIDAPPTNDLAAYDLYLRAREGPRIFKSTGDVQRHYQRILPLLEAAVARDPNFAFAYCELAKTYDALYYHGYARTAADDPAVDYRSLAEAALAKAQRLRPGTGEVHLTLASHFLHVTRDNEQAEIEVNLARAALPNSADVEEIAGEIARSQNHWEEAIRCLERAVALEPRENVNRFTLANTYRLLRRYEAFDRLMGEVIATMTPRDAVAYRLFRTLGSLERRADLAPLRAGLASLTPADEATGEIIDEYSLFLVLDAHDPDGVSRLLAATAATSFVFNGTAYPKAWFEGLAARMRHDPAGAKTAFASARAEVDRELHARSLNGRMLSLLAVIDAGLGDRENAVREAQQACEALPVEKASLDAPIAAVNLAVVYAWTDQPDLACEVLERWVDRPAGTNLPAQPTYGDLRLNPVWDPLQSNARFAVLTARLAPAPAR